MNFRKCKVFRPERQKTIQKDTYKIKKRDSAKTVSLFTYENDIIIRYSTISSLDRLFLRAQHQLYGSPRSAKVFLLHQSRT